MVVPVVDHPCVAATTGLLDELVEDVLLGSPFDAQVLLNLRAHDAEVAGHGYDGVAFFGLFFQHDDLLARFGRLLGGGGAGQAHADNQHVAILFLGNVRRYRRRRQEVWLVLGGRNALGACARVRAAACRSALRCAASQAGACGNGRRGTQPQERAATQILFHHVFPLLSLACRIL